MEATRDGADVVIRLRYAEAVVLSRLLVAWEEQGVDDTLPFGTRRKDESSGI